MSNHVHMGNKTNIISLSSAELALRVVNVNYFVFSLLQCLFLCYSVCGIVLKRGLMADSYNRNRQVTKRPRDHFRTYLTRGNKFPICSF